MPPELNEEQSRQLAERLWPMMDYLHRLRNRLAALKFPRDGTLYQNVVAARQALTDLYRQVDVMSRHGSVGREFRSRQDDPPGDKSCIVPLEEQSRRSEGRERS